MKTVGDVMTKGLLELGEGTALVEAAAAMIHGGFRHLPVLEDGKPCGIVSIRDLMRVALEDVSPRGV